jgi:hypothetical protein
MSAENSHEPVQLISTNSPVQSIPPSSPSTPGSSDLGEGDTLSPAKYNKKKEQLDFHMSAYKPGNSGPELGCWHQWYDALESSVAGRYALVGITKQRQRLDLGPSFGLHGLQISHTEPGASKKKKKCSQQVGEVHCLLWERKLPLVERLDWSGIILTDGLSQVTR